MLPRPALVLALGLALAALPRPTQAAAPEVTLEQIEEARELYQAGSKLYEAGRYLEAEADFERVHELIRSASILFDIALCQEKQRRWGVAADGFSRFLRESRKVAHRKRLEKRVVALRQRAARQAELSVLKNPPGRDQGRPGAPGNEMLPLGEELVLGAGESATPESDDSDSAAAAAAAVPTAAPATAEQPRSRKGLWIGLGVGLAVVAGGAVATGLALSSSHAPVTATWGEIGPGAALVSF